MLLLLPFVVIFLIIVAIDYIYYSDVPPAVKTPKEVEQMKPNEVNSTTNYLDKYIKK